MRFRLLTAFSPLLLAPAASAQTCEARVFAANPATNALLGQSVLFDGDEVLAGAPGALGGSGIAVGAVHVFDRESAASPWVEQAVLQPGTLIDRDNFGAALARDGDTLVVGAPELSTVVSSAPGRAYVFERVSASVWNTVAELSPPDGVARDQFGAAVAVEGDTLLVGAPGHDDAAAPGGSVYVYRRNGSGVWQLAQRIDKPQTFNGTSFGAPLALEGDLACIGAPTVNGSGISTGAVFAYTRSGAGPWSFLQEVQPTGLGIADLYGESLALDVGTLAVGAPQHNGVAGDEGAVWVYDYDATTMTFGAPVKLTPTQSGTANRLGSAIAMDGDRLLVGAETIDSAYVYDRSGTSWSSPRWITPSLTGGSTSAGKAVAISGDTAVIGDSRDSTFTFQDGAFYAADVTLADVDQNGLSDVCEGWWSVSCTQTVPNSTGGFATMEAAGSPFAADQSLNLTVSGLPSFQFGLLVASETPGLVVMPGGTQGNLCLGGTIGRFNGQIAPSNSAGQLVIDVPIGLMPPPLPAAVSAGETWYFQLWHRDVNPTQTANFSEAIEVPYI